MITIKPAHDAHKIAEAIAALKARVDELDERMRAMIEQHGGVPAPIKTRKTTR